MTKNFLEIDDLSPAELEAVLDLSEMTQPPKVLDGLGVALIFEKPSARTRNSMEMAVTQLGGHPVYIQPGEIGFDVRESVEDIARTLSCYYAVIAARVFEHDTLDRMAAAASVPVVNLLSNERHPMQAIGDLLTIRHEYSVLEGRTVAYVGDANNVAMSLALACGLSGMNFRIASPEGHCFDQQQLDRIARTGITAECFEDPSEAVDGVDVVYTDKWTSMGQEASSDERSERFAGFQVDDLMMSGATDKAIFLHCLPAKRGLEVSESVLDGPASRIWEQAENRMHSARGLLSWIMADA